MFLADFIARFLYCCRLVNNEIGDLTEVCEFVYFATLFS